MDAPRVQVCPFKDRESHCSFKQMTKLPACAVAFESWQCIITIQNPMTSFACRCWGTVVWNHLWSTGGDSVMGACLPNYSYGCIVSDERWWHLCGFATFLPECYQRKGTHLLDIYKGSFLKLGYPYKSLKCNWADALVRQHCTWAHTYKPELSLSLWRGLTEVWTTWKSGAWLYLRDESQKMQKKCGHVSLKWKIMTDLISDVACRCSCNLFKRWKPQTIT